MLSERVRNVIVGLTMLAALAALMVGIFLLGRFPAFSPVHQPYALTLTAPNANGISGGNKINFNGVIVGTVSSVELTADLSGVRIVASIYPGTRLPVETQAIIKVPTAVGNPYVDLYLPGGTALSGKVLGTDGSAKLAAASADTSLIPKSLTDDLAKVAADLHVLLGDPKVQGEFKEIITNVRDASGRLRTVLVGIDAMVGDPKTQQDFKESLANIREASGNLKTALADIHTTIAKANTTIDKFGTAADGINAAATQASGTLHSTEKEILRVSEKLVAVLGSIERTSDALAKGDGTAGKLVKDPRLYDGLVDLTQSLKTTSDELNLLIQKWKQEGLPLRLK